VTRLALDQNHGTTVHRSSMTREAAPVSHSHHVSMTRATPVQSQVVHRPSVTRKSVTGVVRQEGSHSHIRQPSHVHENVHHSGQASHVHENVHHSRQASHVHENVHHSRQASHVHVRQPSHTHPAVEHHVNQSQHTHHSQHNLQESRTEERRSITKDEAKRGEARLMDSHVQVGSERMISENVLDCIEQSRIPR
jgi:hypothetical protein